LRSVAQKRPACVALWRFPDRITHDARTALNRSADRKPEQTNAAAVCLFAFSAWRLGARSALCRRPAAPSWPDAERPYAGWPGTSPGTIRPGACACRDGAHYPPGTRFHRRRPRSDQTCG
jgi:hypothetical protein